MKIRDSVFYKILMIVTLTAIIATLLHLSNLLGLARYELCDKTSLKINLHSMSPGITTISADPRNEVFLKVVVTDSTGNPVPYAKITITEKNDLGTFSHLSKRTSKKGVLFTVYSPPDEAYCLKTKAATDLTFSVSLKGTTVKDSMTFSLVRVPVVFVHGYKASPEIFGNFMDYLKSSGFMESGLDYNSGLGVISGANSLDTYLKKLSAEYAKKGVLANSFNLIAHSMGGLVARYYTCSPDYAGNNNVNKIIFLSTPQKGSPFASLGLKYYNDRGINDLIPDNELFTKIFPSMINEGLNNKIRTASILGQYDEVVSSDSASLEKWNIHTEIFSVGESNFTVDKLLTGKIVEATNHKLVLDNLKVFERVEEMLLSELPYPKIIKSANP